MSERQFFVLLSTFWRDIDHPEFLWQGAALLVIFALYAILVSPDDAASLVGTIWDILVNGIKNIGRFFDTLLSR